jgi:hypothetical protein
MKRRCGVEYVYISSDGEIPDGREKLRNLPTSYSAKQTRRHAFRGAGVDGEGLPVVEMGSCFAVWALPQEKTASEFATVSNAQESAKIIHISEAASHRTRYSDYNYKGVAGGLAPLRPFGKEKDSEDVKARPPQDSAAGGCSGGAACGRGPGDTLRPACGGQLSRQTRQDSLCGPRRKRLGHLHDQPWRGSRFNVTKNKADDIQPSYSPSGKSIAYVYDPGAGDAEIYYIKPDGVVGPQSPTTIGTTSILTGAVNSDCSLRAAPEE